MRESRQLAKDHTEQQLRAILEDAETKLENPSLNSIDRMVYEHDESVSRMALMIQSREASSEN